MFLAISSPVRYPKLLLYILVRSNKRIQIEQQNALINISIIEKSLNIF